MTLRDWVAGQLIDIIEWVDDTDEAMAWRFTRPQNEIKNGAQLIVRPAQLAILIDEGHIADVYQPGRHELSTGNMPLLSSLRGWRYGFASPFKADVLFVSTKQFVGRKWGTGNPVILRDPEIGPVRLRAYGTYAVRVADPRRFVQELAGANATFMVDQVADQLRDMLVATASAVLARGGISIYELSAKYGELAARVQAEAAPQCQQYGLSVTQVVIENISLPPEVEQTLDQKSRMSMLGGDMERYASLQAADAIRDAARNQGSAAGAVIGVGVGAALGSRAATATAPAATTFTPPPVPSIAWYYVIGHERKGPVDDSAIRSLGTIAEDTLVWHAGMSAWTPAQQVPELAGLFPPPVA